MIWTFRVPVPAGSCRVDYWPQWRLAQWMDWWREQLGHWLMGLISTVDSEILTTARKQMGAITDIRPFSSVCSVLVNMGSEGRVGRHSGWYNSRARKSADGERGYKSEFSTRFWNKLFEHRCKTKEETRWDIFMAGGILLFAFPLWILQEKLIVKVLVIIY